MGGGTSGTALAILLARGGFLVDIIETKDQIAKRGSGITLMGNGLRVLSQLGVWEDVLQNGFAYDSVEFRTADGAFRGEAVQPRTGGEDLPATVGASRPRLAQILSDAAVAAGARIRFGISCIDLAEDDTGIGVRFSDGSAERYDVVVGADGIHSQMRHRIHPTAAPQDIGAGIWRVRTRRPAEVTRTVLFGGGPLHVAGITPIGESSAYAFLIEDYRDRLSESPDQLRHNFIEQTLGYTDPIWDSVRASLNDARHLNYTGIETILLPAPWHAGRVVLIGDAAHACPPNLAQGASMGWEDAAVLAELLLAADAIDDELFTRYRERRIRRVEAVVQGSIESIRLALAGQDPKQAELMMRVAPLISHPA